MGIASRVATRFAAMARRPGSKDRRSGSSLFKTAAVNGASSGEAEPATDTRHPDVPVEPRVVPVLGGPRPVHVSDAG